jgi:hypothetical protein
MERLERAIKIAARHPPIKRPATRAESAKPKKAARYSSSSMSGSRI